MSTPLLPDDVIADAYVNRVEQPIEEFKTYTVYYRRWFILAVFSMLSFSNAMVWITFSPIATISQRQWNVNVQWINGLSLVFMIVYIPGSPIAGFMLDFFGMRIGVSIGALLNAIGAWVRVAGSGDSNYFAILFVGQTLAALAQCFILSVPPKISANWFPDKEQATSVAIGSLFNQLGIAFGFFLSPLVVNEYNYHNMMPILMIIQASICTVFGILVVIGLVDRPPTPPSASAEESIRLETEALEIQKQRETSAYGEHKPSLKTRVTPFLDELKKALKPLINISFLILVIGFGSSQGMFYAISTILDQLMKGMDFTSNEVGLVGVTLILGGVFGGFLFNFIADRTGYYVAVMKVSFVGLIGMLLLFTFVMQFSVLYHIKPLMFVSAALLGFMATA
jgi:MFS family permease